LLERMARNDLLALVQPVFLASDLHIAEKRVGRELAATSYAFGTMESLGIRVAYGTDCPVESLNPLTCIAAAVTRRDPADKTGEAFHPEESVDVWTAVDNYTLGTAYANFDDNRLGRIRAGYLADLVLLDRDIFSIPPEQIGRARVLFTMVGGELAYKREAGSLFR
jgi:predicted amidohydrolase YtcJ